MSRVGKKEIQIPSGVEIKITGRDINVKGPLGQETITVHEGIALEQNENVLKVLIDQGVEEKEYVAFHGLYRALINNAIVGVSSGFEKELEIVGVGYRAQQQGNNIQFQLGFSHPILFPAPEGITLEVMEPTKIKVKGASKHMVGQVAANIRELRPPEPYKGKGIRYKGEYIRRKAGKAGK